MKTMKLFSLGMLLTAATLFTGCSGGTTSKTPLGITKELCSYLEKGDYETHFKKELEYWTDEKKSLIPEREQQQYLQNMPKVFMDVVTKERGGYKQITIEEDEDSTDDKVYIHVFYLYNNDKKFDEWYTFVKTDNGWRIQKRGNRKN